MGAHVNRRLTVIGTIIVMIVLLFRQAAMPMVPIELANARQPRCGYLQWHPARFERKTYPRHFMGNRSCDYFGQTGHFGVTD